MLFLLFAAVAVELIAPKRGDNLGDIYYTCRAVSLRKSSKSYTASFSATTRTSASVVASITRVHEGISTRTFFTLV